MTTHELIDNETALQDTLEEGRGYDDFADTLDEAEVRRRLQSTAGGQRLADVIMMDRQGMNGPQIAQALGVSDSRAYQLLYKALRLVRTFKETPFHILSTRARHCLLAEGIKTVEEVRERVESGRLYPGAIPNYGRIAHRDVCRWLGVEWSENELATNPETVNRYTEYLEKRGYKVIKPEDSE